MADTQKKPTKTVAIITYGIAVLCLILGLVLPWGPQTGKDYNAVIMQIPHALECFGVKWDAGAALTYSFPINFWGGEAFELGGLFVLLYALITVVALGALVAVLLGNKEKDTSLNCAGVIEVLSAIILSVLLFMQMANFSKSGYEEQSWSISLVIAFGGALLMLIIQSIYHKGSSGGIKTVLTILSGITIVFCLFSFAAIIPQLAEAMKDVLNGNTGLLDWEYGAVWLNVNLPFSEDYGAILSSLDGLNATASVLMLALGLLMIVNFFLDIAGLAKKTQRWMLLANLIRYGVEVLLVLLVLILGGVAGGHAVGVICYLLLTLSVVLTAINVIRFVTYKEEAAEKPEEKKEPEKKAEAPKKPAPAPRPQPAPQPQAYEEVYEEPVVAEEPAPQPQPQPQPYQPVAEPAPVAAQSGGVYTPVIYNGPRDEFIDTLTNEQRIEFARTFLERKLGDIQGVPEYVVDGENEKFFQSIFIYYARVRGLVSDGLMNKFYEKVKAIKK